MTVLDDLIDYWSAAERVVVLTGAGISTASGIPDFRSPGGRWSTYRPVTLQEFLASEDHRARYWRYKGETWGVIQAAAPNPAHLALAELAGADRIRLLVTQNVDGLHERSGFPADRLVNIHGSDAEVVCFGCKARAPRAVAQAQWEAGRAVPCCDCGSPWKPATISFGQSLVAEDLERADDETAACDLFVAVGTSLVVSPVNGLYLRAFKNGAATAILTASETPFDRSVRFRVREALEEILPAIAGRVPRSRT